MSEIRRENVPNEINIGRDINEKKIPDGINFGKDPERKALDEQIVSEEEMRKELEAFPYPEKSTKTNEKELSPEIIEKIMGKVRDINEKGLAYSGVARSGVEPTFGLQLPPQISDIEQGSKTVQSILENGLKGTLYFNINGRSKNIHEQEVNDFPVMGKEKPQVYYGRFSSGRINIMFDVSFLLKEVDLDFYLKHAQNQRTHSIAAPGLKRNQYMVTPSPEDPNVVIDAMKSGQETESYAPGTGFVTNSGIKAKYFLGIIIPAIMRIATEKEKQQYSVSYMIDHSEDAEAKKQEYMVMAKKAILDVYKNKPEHIIPIYSAEGNLLWPKEMNYEEVKKFVERRDRDK